jgi:hypothetical protein
MTMQTPDDPSRGWPVPRTVKLEVSTVEIPVRTIKVQVTTSELGYLSRAIRIGVSKPLLAAAPKLKPSAEPSTNELWKLALDTRARRKTQGRRTRPALDALPKLDST